MKSLAKTLGELKKSKYEIIPVKEEMRRNLIQMVKNGDPLFPGIIGYDKTVIPALRNAILSRHDFILLGLRGQAKSRILRQLIHFLDEYIPAIEGCPIHDNPYSPFCKACRIKLENMGPDTPIVWIHRDQRYQEKLATPDVTISDLIGDIDPIKAASHKLSYSDEEVIHFGIIPRSNRGIFAINELPDLPPRIQVGLLNIMEEKDIQVRGFPIRIPLDICMVYSANPEDYTNRGNIITPLKDRIDSQIMTHYPEHLKDAINITSQEAWIERNNNQTMYMPLWYREIIEMVAFAARKSEYVDQKSGVSARATINLLENVVSNMEYRSFLTGDKILIPRLCDLLTALTAVTGKIELVYEGEQEGVVLVARKIIGQAIKNIFKNYYPSPSGKKAREGISEPEPDSPYQPILDWFSAGGILDLNDQLNNEEYFKTLDQVTGLRQLAQEKTNTTTLEELALSMEFILEGLHQFSMLSKRDTDSTTSYQDMLKAMLDQIPNESGD